MKAGTLSLTIASTISFIMGAINVALVVYEHRTLRAAAYQDVQGFLVDDRRLERLPGRFEEVSMTVEENHQFSLVNDTAWANLLPPLRGFVRLGPKGRSFATAAYHQLHCVNALRFSYTVARDGLVTDPGLLKPKIPHDNHCFQFLRQALLCRADDSLIAVSNRTLVRAGFGSVHRCANWAHIRQFITANQEKWKDILYLIETYCTLMKGGKRNG